MEGTFTAKNGLLSDKASKGQPVTDLTATLTSHKEKAKLVVNVSGLEQVVNTEKAAVLDCKTIPATLPDGKTLTIGYYKDEKCTEVAGESDRKQEGYRRGRHHSPDCRKHQGGPIAFNLLAVRR